MDNLTHTLLGVVVAETAARFIPTAKSVLPEATRRNLYVALMVVGGNLPDLDSLYAGITGGTLGYLLHHRGHTHTVLGAIVISLLMLAATLAWLRWRRLPSSAPDRWWLVCIALLAPLLHIAMDATNEYGVHPFWPFNNAWFYGDAVFIIEPLFWAAAAPLVFLLRSRLGRAAMIGVLLLGIALSFGTGLVPQALAVRLTLLTVVLLVIAWRVSARNAALTAVVASFGVAAMFVYAGQVARRDATTLVNAQYPNAMLLDQVLSPLPVNPFCWEVITVQLDGDAYTLRQALLSLAPDWLPADACPGAGLNAQTTVALAPITLADSATLQWLDEVTMSRQEIRELLQGNCEAAAFSGFARALWIMRDEKGWLVGDLRYDREPGLGFAEMQIAPEPQQCPRFLPPWTPPRSDLL